MNVLEIASSFNPLSDRDIAYKYLLEEDVLKFLPPVDSNKKQIPPDYCDLARLYKLIRSRKVFTVLEFGLGFSTIIIAAALMKNKEDWLALSDRPKIRNSNAFELHSLDSSKKWLKKTQSMIPKELEQFIFLKYSKVKAGLFQDRICHYYEKIPNIVPDFIYLDGPDPLTVKGEIDGAGWNNPDRVVNAGDLLRLEAMFLPGTCIIVDGRSANAKFLTSHFFRNWETAYNPHSDVHVMELKERPLGKINEATLLYSLGERIKSWE